MKRAKQVNPLVARGLELLGAQDLLQAIEGDHDFTSVHSASQARRAVAVLLLVFAALISVYPLLRDSSYQGSPDLHSTIEMVGALIGLLTGVALIARFTALADRFHLVVGIAFFVNAAEDFIHGFLPFANSRGWLAMPASSADRFIMGTYVTGRLLMGFILIAAPLVAKRIGTSRHSMLETLWVSSIAIVLTAISTAVSWQLPLAQFSYPQYFIARPVDLLSGVVLLLALLMFLREYHRTRDSMLWWISLSLTINVVGQLLMSFSKQLNDSFFDVAHVYKVLGYAVPLLGISLYQISIIRETQRTRKTLETTFSYLMEYLDEIAEAAAQLARGDLTATFTLRSEQDVLNRAFLDIITYLQKVAEVSQKLAVGDIQVEVVPLSDNDILNHSFAQSIQYVREVADVAEQVANEALHVEVHPKSEHDVLNLSLQRMVVNLRQMVAQMKNAMAEAEQQRKNAEEERRKAEAQRAAVEAQNWMRTGQAELSNLMRGEQDSRLLAKQVIAYLAKYLQMQTGAIYLAKEHNEAVELHLVGSYAYTWRKGLNNRFRPGEGFVGQAALEQESIIYTDIPQDYLEIGSGLGGSTPRYILLTPCVYEGNLKGVLELGAIERPTEAQMEFLNQAAENIAIVFHSAQTRRKMQALLKKSQQQAEELQMQQEQFREQ